jgi:hypothetical protein
MGRRKVYETNAARKKAYRLRLKAVQPKVTQPRAVASPKKQRPQSRPKRLATALAELEALLQEYEGWLDALPESLQSSVLAERPVIRSM